MDIDNLDRLLSWRRRADKRLKELLSAEQVRELGDQELRDLNSLISWNSFLLKEHKDGKVRTDF